MVIRIEIPKGSVIKQEAKTVDRILKIPMPVNYGAIVGTIALDGDEYDAAVVNQTFTAGQQISDDKLKMIALVQFIDQSQVDNKAIFLFNGDSNAAFNSKTNTYGEPYSTLYDVEKYVKYLLYYKRHKPNCDTAVKAVIFDKTLQPFLHQVYGSELPSNYRFQNLTISGLECYN